MQGKMEQQTKAKDMFKMVSDQQDTKDIYERERGAGEVSDLLLLGLLAIGVFTTMYVLTLSVVLVLYKMNKKILRHLREEQIENTVNLKLWLIREWKNNVKK